jgi:hypothetical protein
MDGIKRLASQPSSEEARSSVLKTRVVKKLMRPPDNNIAEVRLTVLDCELSGHDTDSSV